MPKTKIYVIGDRESGILFVTTEPLRAALVPRAEIEKYGKNHGLDPEEVLGAVAQASQYMFMKANPDSKIEDEAEQQTVSGVFGDVVSNGSTMSDAEFCFIGEVDAGQVGILRDNFIPLELVLKAMLSLKGCPIGTGPLWGPGDPDP